MFGTEDEMKKRWCPWARVPMLPVKGAVMGPVLVANRGATAFGTTAGSQPAPYPTEACCLGSSCSAWVWTNHGPEETAHVPARVVVSGIDHRFEPPPDDGNGAWTRPDPNGKPNLWVRPWGANRPGTCGLIPS